MANNGQSSSKLADNILDAFETLAKAEVSSAQFDKTVIGIIVSCEDEASGRYKVQYQDAIFYAYSSALDVTYTKGTSVQVRIPNNDWSGRKIIIGTWQEEGIDYNTLIEDPLLRYEYIGVNCITNQDLETGISTYWTEERNNIVLYDVDKGIDEVKLDTTMVADNMKQGNSVILGATIKTNIPEEQRFKGNYGIKYTLVFDDISNVDATIDRYYIVDIDKMSGEPYSYDRPSDQLVPFDVDYKNFLYIRKIELFAKDFPAQDASKPADIFITNLTFQVANRIPEDEYAGTALTVLTPDGNYFKAEENMSSKRAIAQLRIKGKVTNSAAKNIEYYWFIEDLRVNRSDLLEYHKYGGRGWRCLNEYNVTEGDDDNPTNIQYISADNLRMIKSDETRARETKYKCVVRYNGATLEKEFTFTNYDITDEVIITTDRNPNFIDSIGATTLTCVATNGYSYNWAKIDAEGGFESLLDTTAANKEYESALENYNQLKNNMANKVVADNETNRKILQTYKDILDKYEYEVRRKENKIINLQANSIFQEATFKCQAFDKEGLSLGVAAQLVTNVLRAGEDEQQGNLLITNGSQIYKYDAKGVAPTNEFNEDPQEVLPLGFILRNAEGLEIPQQAIRDTDISWIVPIKDTMIQDYFGSLIAHNEEEGYEIYNGKNLSYTIRDKYYSQKDNNVIELRIIYQGVLYVAQTNLLFVKDGENGTNGTVYTLKLIPSSDTIGRLKVVKPGDQGGNWLTAQLWYNGIKIYEGTSNNDSAGIKVNWSIVGDKRQSHNITVSNGANGQPSWRCTGSSLGCVDIAKCTLTYKRTMNGKSVETDIVATQPIMVANNTYNPNNYRVSLKKGTGFTHVTFSEDGLTPDFDSHTPFEIAVWKYIGGQWGDITGHPDLNYSWSCNGNLQMVKGYNATDPACMFEPVGIFDSEEMGNNVVCTVRDGSTTIGTLIIPIHFLLNRYGHSAINEWDGNSIQLDADGNTMLLAPQGGFGQKERDNSYTGLLLGRVRDYQNNVDHVGMLGYNWGTRTMFLNSENGAAIFGSARGSQIVIDPGNGYEITDSHARLYSNEFYKRYNPQTGLPDSYSASNETGGGKNNHIPMDTSDGKGMLIDLTEPEIRWGNGNFYVDKQGYIMARGGGHIAGWKINDYRIDAIDNGDRPTDTGNTGMSSVYEPNGAGVTAWNVRVPQSISSGGIIKKAIAFWAGGTGTDSSKFHVSHDGYLRVQDATIGSGSTGSLIYIGKSGDNSAIYTFNHYGLTNNKDGFYMGTDGISLGSQFKVIKDGVVTVGKGAVDNSSTKHWTMEANGGDESRIYYQKNALDSATNGVYIGTDGIALGDNTTAEGRTGFQINRDGTFVFRGGYIGTKANGWYVNDTQIYNGKADLLDGQPGIFFDTKQGISIGTNPRGGPAFYVKKDGIFFARQGYIGDTDQGWKVEDNKISNNNVMLHNGTGTALAFTAGGATADAPFWVKHDGSIKATSGTIGGWKLTDKTIASTNGNVVMSSSGDIDCSAGSKWYIHSDGTASFGGLTIYNDGSIDAKNMKTLETQVANIQGQLDAAKAEIGDLRTNGKSVSTEDFASDKASSAESNAKSYTDRQVSSAKSSAASDATTKANNALTEAKSYADGLFSAGIDKSVTFFDLRPGGTISITGQKQAAGGIAVTTISLSQPGYNISLAFTKGLLSAYNSVEATRTSGGGPWGT